MTDHATIGTYFGKAIPVWEPKPEHLDPRDIAWAHSMQVRYCGHISRFYSVAEHSVIFSYLVPVEHALSALMDDAPEAYICDLTSPVKYQTEDYRKLEAVWRPVIAERFGCVNPLPAEMKVFHDRLSRAEQVKLRPPCHWDVPSTYDDYAIDQMVQGHRPEVARMKFLHRFCALTSASPNEAQALFTELINAPNEAYER